MIRLLLLAALALEPAQPGPAQPGPAPQVLDDGRGVRRILAVQPFTLGQPYTYEWSAEHPQLTHGQLLILEADPAFLLPSDTRQAVLYAGAVPVERLSTGWPSGVLAVIVPGDADLSATLLYFGGYELPERVSADDGAVRLRLAERQGIRPPVAPAAAPVVQLSDREALGALAAELLAGWGG